MEQLSFLNNIIIFIVINSIALLTLNIKKVGKFLTHTLSLVSVFIFLGMLFTRDSFALSEMFLLDGNKLLLVKIVSILNILMILLNGFDDIEKVKSTILTNYIFAASVFLLGATELITFYVALETIALLTYTLVALSDLEFSREAAIKYLIQGSVVSAIFLLGAAFYLGSTGSLSFVGINVQNQELYAVSLGIFIITAAFKLGAFPFHAWIADVYSNVSKGNLATNFFVSKIVVGFKFITLLQLLLLESEPQFQDILIRAIQVLAVLSAFYGNIMAIVQGQFKRIVAYSSVAHTGYLLMSICLNPEDGFEKQLISFLVLYSLTATGVILIINKFIKYTETSSRSLLKSGFYRNKTLSIMLVVFVLSLAGIPLTSGFAMKYMLFTNYFREGFALESISILISSIIGLAYYIRFISDLFSEEEIVGNQLIIKTSLSETLVHVIILISIFSVGLIPSLLLNLK